MTDGSSANDIPKADVIRALIENQKENNTFIRHYEDVRFKISQINVTLAVLLVGASRFGDLHSSKILLSLFIVILGVHGILVSAKYTERADRHAVISRSYRRAASDLMGDFNQLSMEMIHQGAAEKHQSDRSFTGIFQHVRARIFWILIHAAVVVLGIFVACT